MMNKEKIKEIINYARNNCYGCPDKMQNLLYKRFNLNNIKSGGGKDES